MTILIAEGEPSFDPAGLYDDAAQLGEDGWVLSDNGPAYVTWTYGALRLSASVFDENRHRLKWEINVFAGDVQIAYASRALRPGDMTSERRSTLIKDAADACEKDLAAWAATLNETKKAIGL